MSAASVTQFAHQTKGDHAGRRTTTFLSARVGRPVLLGRHRAVHELLRRHRRPERRAARRRDSGADAAQQLHGAPRASERSERARGVAADRALLAEAGAERRTARPDQLLRPQRGGQRRDDPVHQRRAREQPDARPGAATAPASSACSIRRTASPSRAASSRATPTRRICRSRSSRWPKSTTWRARRACRKATIASGSATTTAPAPADRRAGVSLDQKLTNQFGLFGRYGTADADVDNATTSTASGSRCRTALSSIRWTSGASATRRPISAHGDNEKLVEGYYNFQISEKLRLSLHLQHVLRDASRARRTSGSWLPGVRLQARF